MSKNKNFTQEELVGLKENILELCEQSLAKQGYKKTSIGYLTKQVNISPASFYRLFETKEALFMEVFKKAQNRLRDDINHILDKEPNKKGFMQAILWLFKEYEEKPFLYDFTNPEFQNVISKLSVHDLEELKKVSIDYSEYMINKVNLKYKVDQELVFDTIQVLLNTVVIHDQFINNKQVTFKFLIENMINELFI